MLTTKQSLFAVIYNVVWKNESTRGKQIVCKTTSAIY